MTSSSASPKIALLALLALGAAVWPKTARAQACCMGATAVGVGRLAPYEEGILGIGARSNLAIGSMSRDGVYSGFHSHTLDIGFEQTLLGTVRVLDHGQLTFVLPFVETYRTAPGLTDMGGGLGDVMLGARYDFIEPGVSPTWPGVALTFGLTLPTGTPPESSESALAAGATGTGTLLMSAQVIAEKGYKNVFFQAAVGAEWRSPRVVSGLHTQRGPALSAFGAAGYSWKSGFVAAATLSYRAETEARLEGLPVPGSGRELTRVGLSAGYPLSNDYRIQGTTQLDLPIRPLSRNEPVGVTVSVVAIRSAW